MTSSVRRSLFTVLLLALASCTSIRPDHLERLSQPAGCGGINPELSTPLKSSRYVFKCALDIRDHHLTGLMYVKKMPDSSTRIAFTNEFGMTWFDLVLRRDSFEVAYCFEPMNKKPLLRILRTNFELLFCSEAGSKRLWYRHEPTGNLVMKSNSGPYTVWYTSDSSCQVVKIGGRSNLLDKTLITFSGYRKNVPGSIRLLTPMIGLEMELERDW